MDNLTAEELKQLAVLINDSTFLQGLTSAELNLLLQAMELDFSTLTDIELKNLAALIDKSAIIQALTDVELNSMYDAIQHDFRTLTETEIKMLTSTINDTSFLNAFTDAELNDMINMIDELAEVIATFDDMTDAQFELLFSLVHEILFLHGYTYDELMTFADRIEEGAYWAKQYPETDADDIVDMIDNLSYTSPLDDPLALPDWKKGILGEKEPTFPPEWDVYNLDNPIYVPNDPDHCFMFMTIWLDVPEGNLVNDPSNQVMIRYFTKNSGGIGYVFGEDIVLGSVEDHDLYDVGFLATPLTISEDRSYHQLHVYFDGLTNGYLFAGLNKKEFIEDIKSVVDAGDYIKFNKTDSTMNTVGVTFIPKPELLTYINESIPMLPGGTADQQACYPTPYTEDPEPPLDIILYDKYIFNEDEPAMNKLYRTSPVEKYNLDRISDSSYKYECIDLGMLYSGFYDILLHSCSFVKKVDRVLFDPRAFLQLPYFQAIDNMYIESYLLLFNDYNIQMDSDRNWMTQIPERTFNNLLIQFIIENLLLTDTGGSYSIMDTETLNELTYEMQFVDQTLRGSGFRSIIMDCTPVWTSRVQYDYINIVETLFRKE